MLTTPDHDDAVTSPPTFGSVGPKPKGFYQDCDPAIGQAGTVFRAEDLNEAIVNLRALLDAAAVPGTKGDPAMLRTALHRLYAGAGINIVATGTLTPDAAGLVVVDATAGNITLTLPSAASLPAGRPDVSVVRVDAAVNNTVRIVPPAGQTLRRGVVYLDSGQTCRLRADGVNTWHILVLPIQLLADRTIQVSPTGSATPADPFVDPFNSLAGALNYLQPYQLLAGVTIQIAAGTYVATTALNVWHRDAAIHLAIRGAGPTQTILQFSKGIQFFTGIAAFATLKLQGDGSGTSTGLLLNEGRAAVDNVTVEGYAPGVWLRPGTRLTIANTLVTQNNTGEGLIVDAGVNVEGSGTAKIDARTNGGVANVLFQGGTCLLPELYTDGGARGLQVSGPARVWLTKCTVWNVTNSAQAIMASSGAQLLAYQPQAANNWSATAVGGAAATIRAESYACIQLGTALWSNNRAVTSPAINTVGNVQAFIQVV